MTNCKRLFHLITAALIVFSGQPAGAAVTGACHVSPIVADLDRSLRFYRDLLGLEVLSGSAGALQWDTNPELLDLHGVPQARLRYFAARIPGMSCGIEPVQFDRIDRKAVAPRLKDAGTVMPILLVRNIDSIFMEFRGLKTGQVKPRVQDPGAYRLQLNVDDVSATLNTLKNSGSRVISTAGRPVRMLLGGPSLVAAVQDPNNLFLVLQQGM